MTVSREVEMKTHEPAKPSFVGRVLWLMPLIEVTFWLSPRAVGAVLLVLSPLIWLVLAPLVLLSLLMLLQLPVFWLLRSLGHKGGHSTLGGRKVECPPFPAHLAARDSQEEP